MPEQSPKLRRGGPRGRPVAALPLPSPRAPTRSAPTVIRPTRSSLAIFRSGRCTVAFPENTGPKQRTAVIAAAQPGSLCRPGAHVARWLLPCSPHKKPGAGLRSGTMREFQFPNSLIPAARPSTSSAPCGKFPLLRTGACGRSSPASKLACGLFTASPPCCSPPFRRLYSINTARVGVLSAA
jgi:hypothetical protein